MRGIHIVIVSSSIALAACALNQPPPSEELRAKALPNVKTPVQWASQGGGAAASADNWAGGDVSTYSVGGSVSGLVGTLVLQDNGADDLSVGSNGAFTFATRLAAGSPNRGWPP